MFEGLKNIGSMDHRITFVKKVKVTTSTGSQTLTDQILVTVWASRESADSERVLDDKVVALNVTVFQFRYHPTLAAENILDLILVDQDGNRFEIYSHETIGRKRFMKIKCQIRE
jgi:hypothetical protein